MEITLRRTRLTPKATLGELAVDGIPECVTLEDVVRAPGVKVWGATAIDAGRYEVTIDFSQRFNRPMPHVMNVPNFTGIRIHKGNTSANTEGCILLGREVSGDDLITHSTEAWDSFWPQLGHALDFGEEVWLTITNEFGEAGDASV